MNICKYDVVQPDAMYYLHFTPMHLLYFPEVSPLHVACSNHSYTTMITGFIKIHEGCAFHSDTISMEAVAHANVVYIPPSQSWSLPVQEFNVSMDDLNVLTFDEGLLSLLNDTELPYLSLSDPFFRKTTQIPIMSTFGLLVVIGFVAGTVCLYCINLRLKELKISRQGSSTAAAVE